MVCSTSGVQDLSSVGSSAGLAPEKSSEQRENGDGY